jgi:hypothetical protein
MPLNVQEFMGMDMAAIPLNTINPYYQPFEEGK